MKVEDYAASEGEFQTSIGAKEESDSLWILDEYVGSDSSLKGFGCTVEIDGTTGKYSIMIPIAGDKPYDITLIGSFDLASYKEGDSISPESIIAETHELDSYLQDYPTDTIPVAFNTLYAWLNENELGLTVYDLGFKQYN